MKSLVCREKILYLSFRVPQTRDFIPEGTLNDRYKVYTLQTRDFIPGGTLNDRYKVYTLQTRDFISGGTECRSYIYHSEFPRV
jgi:hypothetical protein